MTDSADSGTRSRYPGSPPFGESELDQRLFWGRPTESESVFHSVLSHDLFVLYAMSGTGKTSLLRAGVMHRLIERDYWPVLIRLNHPESTPVELVQEALNRSAASADVEVLGADRKVIDLWDLLSEVEIWRGDILLSPVLIFDQFEELFTLWSAETQRDFIVDFGNIVRGRAPKRIEAPTAGVRPRQKVVLSLREDFLGELDAFSNDVPQILSNRYRLRRLTRDQAAQAITEPAALDDPALATKPFGLAPETVTMILDHLSREQQQGATVNADTVEAFQLQIICQHIEDVVAVKEQPSDKPVVIEPRDLDGEAGLTTILTDFYAREVAGFESRNDRRNVQRLCESGLISQAGRRLSLEQQEIEREHSVHDSQLEHMVQKRLLRKEPRVGSFYYELAHDSLVSPVLAHRDDRRQQRRVLVAKSLATVALVSVLVIAGLLANGTLSFRPDTIVDLGDVSTALTSASFGPDGELVVTASEDGTASVWTDEGELISTMQHDGPVVSAVFDVSGHRILTASSDGTARVWDLCGSELARVKHQGELNGASFNMFDDPIEADCSTSPDDDDDGGDGGESSAPRGQRSSYAMSDTVTELMIVTASQGGTAAIWDLDGDLLATLPHDGPVNTAIFSPAGTLALTASDDGTASVWDLTSDPLGAPIQHYEHDGPVLSARFDASAIQVLTATLDGSHLYQVDELLDTFGHSGAVNSARFVPPGSPFGNPDNPQASTVVTASPGGNVQVWWSGTSAPQSTFEHRGPVAAAVVSPDGTILASASETGTAKLWGPQGNLIADLNHGGPVNSVHFSPDSQRIITASDDSTAQIWDRNGSLLATLTHVIEIQVVAASNRRPIAGADYLIMIGDDELRGITDGLGRGFARTQGVTEECNGTDERQDQRCYAVTVTADGYTIPVTVNSVVSARPLVELVGSVGSINGNATTSSGGTVNVELRANGSIRGMTQTTGDFVFADLETPNEYTVSISARDHEVVESTVTFDPTGGDMTLESLTLKPQRFGQILPNGVNIRTAPELAAEEVAFLEIAPSEAIAVLGTIEDGWYNVLVDGRRGWIFGGFVVPADPGFAVARTSTRAPARLLDESGNELQDGQGEPVSNASGSFVLVVDATERLWQVLLPDNTRAWVEPSEFTVFGNGP